MEDMIDCWARAAAISQASRSQSSGFSKFCMWRMNLGPMFVSVAIGKASIDRIELHSMNR
jgi:hypothetical protein